MLSQSEEKYQVQFIYDGSFEGLLSCVFEAFDKKTIPLQLVRKDQPMLFCESVDIKTDPKKAERVLTGLKKKISKSALRMLFICFLSESEEIETHLFKYICKAFLAKTSIELNFADEDVLELSKMYRKVTFEAERMRQFVRFQKTADQIFFAAVEPMYNVLPIVSEFFQDRFADQAWIIYDIKRKYGLYYDLEKVEQVYFDNIQLNQKNGKLASHLLAEDELDYQTTWKQYIKSISIQERKNLKLQRQFMPTRFWKYLTEKQS